MSDKYPVATMAQMAAIPEPARQRFLLEFPELLETAAKIISLQQVLGDDAEVMLAESIWIDDGATNVTVNMDFQDADGTSLAKSTTTYDHAKVAASVGRNAERQDHEDGLGPKDEHAVGSGEVDQ